MPSCTASPGVHELFLRLSGAKDVGWRNRIHYVQPATPIDLDEIPDLDPRRSAELVALDDALAALTVLDARKAQVIELRFFGGLSVEETAEFLKISPQSVMRDWK